MGIGQNKLRTMRPVMFASLGLNVTSVVCSKDFWWGRGNGFGCIGKCRDWGTITKQHMQKSPDFKTNTGVL